MYMLCDYPTCDQDTMTHFDVGLWWLQVPHSTGGLPHYAYTAPPAGNAGSTAGSSQDLLMSQTGHDGDLNRQLF